MVLAVAERTQSPEAAKALGPRSTTGVAGSLRLLCLQPDDQAATLAADHGGCAMVGDRRDSLTRDAGRRGSPLCLTYALAAVLDVEDRVVRGDPRELS